MRRDPLDYSPYYLKAKVGMSNIHNHVLKNKYEEAIVEVDEIIAELRLVRAALTDIREKHYEEPGVVVQRDKVL